MNILRVIEVNQTTALIQLEDKTMTRITLDEPHKTVLQEFYAQKIVNETSINGGYTYPPVEAGYMVSEYPECEEVFNKLTQQDVLDYMGKHADVLNDPTNYLGTWWNINDGKYYLDVSKCYDNIDEALASGWRHKQEAIYDVGSGESVFVYDVVEIKRNIPLALIKLYNGKLRFIATSKLPKHRVEQHRFERRAETLDGQL